jgi:hypothetical protein
MSLSPPDFSRLSNSTSFNLLPSPELSDVSPSGSSHPLTFGTNVPFHPHNTPSVQLHQQLVRVQADLDRVSRENQSLQQEHEMYKYVKFFRSFRELMSCRNLFLQEREMYKCVECLHSFCELTHCRNLYDKHFNSLPAFLSTSPSSSSVSFPKSDQCKTPLALPDVDHSQWPKATDFSEEQRTKLFWTKAHWLAHENGRKSVSKSSDQDDDLYFDPQVDHHDKSKKGQQGRARAAEGINVNMRYVVDRTGAVVDGHHATVMRGTARAFWAELSDKGLAPAKWKGDSSLFITQTYRLQMEKAFEELQLCEDGWKAEQIAIDYYSSWRVAQRNKGLFNVPVKPGDRIKKEEDEVTLDIQGDDEDILECARKRKISHEASTASKKSKPIDVDDQSEPEIIEIAGKRPEKGKEPEKVKGLLPIVDENRTNERPRPKPLPRLVVCF